MVRTTLFHFLFSTNNLILINYKLQYTCYSTSLDNLILISVDIGIILSELFYF